MVLLLFLGCFPLSGQMIGYLLIIAAASFWGVSGVYAKWLFVSGVATPLTVSQTRVIVGWLTFFLLAWWRRRSSLKVPLAELWKFVLLGVIGVAGANYGLYFAISRMDAAVADCIQFTAPAIVALWMWVRGEERGSVAKTLALVSAMVGVAFALGVAEREITVSWLGALSALGSAFSFAFLMVWGKKLSRRYPSVVSLHYAMLSAALFWFCVQPPQKLATEIRSVETLGLLVSLGVLSVVLPYGSFFAGLRRVPASVAGVISTLEPVVMAIAAHFVLGESLGPLQIAGVMLVVLGIAVMQLDRDRCDRGDESKVNSSS